MLTREQIEACQAIILERVSHWTDEDGRRLHIQLKHFCDLALAAKEMEEELAKARYHVLGYKGDYDELCKRYTTCERELGSVMKERDAMREAIKRAVAVLTNPSVEDLFNLRAYLESVLQGEAVSDFTCPKCGTGLNYVTGPVEPRAAEARTDHQADGESADMNLSGMERSRAGGKPATSRPAIIEECARVAVEHGELCVRMGNVEKARTAATIADAIRALAPREQHGEREQKIKFEDDGSVTVTTKFEELAKWDADLRAAPSLSCAPDAWLLNYREDHTDGRKLNVTAVSLEPTVPAIFIEQDHSVERRELKSAIPLYRAAPSLTKLPEERPDWFVDLLNDDATAQEIWTALRAKVRDLAEQSK